MIGPTCELWVNGVRVPDAGPDLYAGRATALEGLSLTWGRDGPNEQPGPATCNFTVLDTTGEPDFLDRLHVGSTVQVWAQGDIPGGATPPSTVDDGSFATKPDGPVPALDVGLIYTQANYVGQTLEWFTLPELTPGEGDTTPGSVRIPPRPFSPAGQLPNAWDTIPKSSAGETWTITARVKAPPGVVVTTFAPIWFAAPYPSSSVSASVINRGDRTWTGTGEWQTKTVTTEIKTLAAPAWIAVLLTADNTTGRRWQDQTPTLAWSAAASTWDDYPLRGYQIYVDDVAIWPPPVTSRRVLAFSGAVSDVAVAPAGGGGITADLIATDLAADLANRVVGDDPWPAQTLAARSRRIVALAGLASTALRVDTTVADTMVSWRDIDAQPVYGLLQDLAQTVGGVLWAATHAATGPYLWLEDTTSRASMRTLELSGGVVVITNTTGRGAAVVSACDLLEEPVTWEQSTEDVVTVVAVTWQDQTLNDDGEIDPTDRTETVTDTAALATYGTRRLSVGTELITAGDAGTLAAHLLAISRSVGWRLTGLTMDTTLLPDHISSVSDADRATTLLNLLDGTTRLGLAVTVVDMPGYAPLGAMSAVYVEGGSYSYAGGGWTLELDSSPATAQGESATWADIPAEGGGTWVIDATNPATNPGLESGAVTGFNTGSSAVSVVTADTTAPIAGTWSAVSARLPVTSTTTLAATVVASGLPGRFPVVAGAPVTASMDVKVERAGRRIETLYLWYSAATGGSLGSSAAVPAVPDAAPGTSYRVNGTATPPAGALFAYFQVRVYTLAGLAVEGEKVWLDNLRFGGLDYFDGDTPDTAEHLYQWTGTAKASTSERLSPSGPVTGWCWANFQTISWVDLYGATVNP